MGFRPPFETLILGACFLDLRAHLTDFLFETRDCGGCFANRILEKLAGTRQRLQGFGLFALQMHDRGGKVLQMVAVPPQCPAHHPH